MWGDPEVPGSGVKTFTIFSDRRRESGTIIKSIRYIFRKLVYSPSNLRGLSLRILRATNAGISPFSARDSITSRAGMSRAPTRIFSYRPSCKFLFGTVNDFVVRSG